MRLIPLGAAALAALLALAHLPAAADEPPAKPWPRTVCAESRAYCAVMDPASWTTEVRVGEAGAVVWSMAGWFRQAALTDDGETLIAGHDGMNLIPLDSGADLVILTFYRRGQAIAEITLAEVFDDLGSLKRTLSHDTWGHYLGFDPAGRYLIETVEGRRLAFDGATGEIVR